MLIYMHCVEQTQKVLAIPVEIELLFVILYTIITLHYNNENRFFSKK